MLTSREFIPLFRKHCDLLHAFLTHVFKIDNIAYPDTSDNDDWNEQLIKNYAMFCDLIHLAVNYYDEHENQQLIDQKFQNFCWEIVLFYERLYQQYYDNEVSFVVQPFSFVDGVFYLNNPRDFFLSHDCFNPLGTEEWAPILEEIKFIIQNVCKFVSRNILIPIYKYRLPSKAPIAIGYRDEANGAGAFYDHFTLQNITQHPTKVATSVNNTWGTEAFSNYINQSSLTLSVGETVSSETAYNEGLLVISGRSSRTESKRLNIHNIRTQNETTLLRQAKLHGQPVLGICGGSWSIIEAWGGTVREVKDHTGPMPTLNNKGQIHNNHLHHQVHITEATLLHSAFEKNPPKKLELSVNSVHWKAVEEKKLPQELEVNALSGETSSNSAKKPEVCVEAVGSKVGAPLICYQWHPEAFNVTDDRAAHHHSGIKYMAQAGDAYHQKKIMLASFCGQYHKVTENQQKLRSYNSRLEHDALSHQNRLQRKPSQ